MTGTTLILIGALLVGGVALGLLASGLLSRRNARRERQRMAAERRMLDAERERIGRELDARAHAEPLPTEYPLDAHHLAPRTPRSTGWTEPPANRLHPPRAPRPSSRPAADTSTGQLFADYGRGLDGGASSGGSSGSHDGGSSGSDSGSSGGGCD